MIQRDYQLASSEAVFDQWTRHQATLLVMATGLGKTVCFADIIQRKHPGRALVIANREELIFQARDKIERVTGLTCTVDMADMVANPDPIHGADVVIATVQTLISGVIKRRMSRFNPNDFAVLVIDEAHMSVSRSFRRVIDYFKTNPDLRILGVTATPSRHDQQSLGQIYQSVAANYPILYGIENGWLCDVVQHFVPVTSLDYSHIKTVAGDLDAVELSREMEKQENVVGYCQPTLEVLFGLPPQTLQKVEVAEWGNYLGSLGRQPRRAIMFTASVFQAELCAEIFNRVLPGMCASLNGKTPKDERRDMLRQFSSGELRMVMNCGVLTHGFDDPGVEVVVMARPTKSKSLYEQMLGRATRPLPGVVDGPGKETPLQRLDAIWASQKRFCRILDFVGNSGSHKLITSMDVLGGKVSDEAVAKAVKRAVTLGRPVSVRSLLNEAEVKVVAEQKERKRTEAEKEAARKAHLVAKSSYAMRQVDPFDALGVTRASPFARGAGRPPTEKMVAYLSRHGVDAARHRLCFTDAGKMIGKIRKLEESAPATDPQKRRLRTLGYSENELEAMTKPMAIKEIDAAAKNGWRRLFTNQETKP